MLAGWMLPQRWRALEMPQTLAGFDDAATLAGLMMPQHWWALEMPQRWRAGCCRNVGGLDEEMLQ
jgi:hypothetical protein